MTTNVIGLDYCDAPVWHIEVIIVQCVQSSVIITTYNHRPFQFLWTCMSQSSKNLTFFTEDGVVCLARLIIFIRWRFLPSITRRTKYVSCNVQISRIKYLGLLIWEIKVINEMLMSPNLMIWLRFCARMLGRWEAMEAHKTTDFLVDCFHMSQSHLY